MQLSVLCGPRNLWQLRNPALVVAHPGHELKIFGWLSACKPRVHILTDGSGGGVPRVHSTATLLKRLGAIPGEVFGRVSDAEIYGAILDKRIATFLDIVDGLATSLIENETDFVAGDATEGFNPTHDVCRALLNAAVSIAQRVTGRFIANYEFCLTEWEQHCREFHDHHCWHLRLEDSLLREKLAAASDYIELKAEIQQAIASKGREYFRIECLRNVVAPVAQVSPESGSAFKPYYETHGEERVAEDKYASVIRYQQHMLPILAAVQNYALDSRKNPKLYFSSTAVAGL
ncbi:MAG: hypothetical protein WBQ68_04915 [Terriglobales bacterium]